MWLAIEEFIGFRRFLHWQHLIFLFYLKLQEKIFTLKADHDTELAELKRELQTCRGQLCEAVRLVARTCSTR